MPASRLRIGRGTRIKIYEAMAAGIPVVSTTVGAEGLEVNGISIADEHGEFAARCLDLLESPERRALQAAAARQLVVERFSWEQAAVAMEQVLLTPLPRPAR